MTFRLDGVRDHYRASGLIERSKIVLAAERTATDHVVRADKVSGRAFASAVRTAPTKLGRGRAP
jgi:hypothetical protein